MVEAREPAESGAGQDPRKRRQIIDGARRLFFTLGFDGSSMGDIAREAGVSKGTLYVYFDSKEKLFAEVVREECLTQAGNLFTLDPDEHDVAAVLGRVGRGLNHLVMTPAIINAMRTVIAVGDRMPDLGTDYYVQGPLASTNRLADYLTHQVEIGLLVIEDVALAAAQFLDMVQATLERPLLFGARTYPADAEIDRVVDGAVRVFLAAYGNPAARPR